MCLLKYSFLITISKVYFSTNSCIFPYYYALMKMKKIKRIFLVTLLALLANTGLKAQETFKSSILELKGYVYDGEEKVDGVMIRLYQNERVVKKVLTKRNAKFEFILFKNSRYKIEIVKDGYVKEFILVATKESPDYSNKKYVFEFGVDLKKLEEFKGMELTDFDYPSAKISYDVESNEYTHDKFYDKMIKTRIAKLKLMSDSKLEKGQ